MPTSATALLDDGVQSNAFDADTAWAKARLSKLSLSGAAGFHTIQVMNATGVTGGGGFIRIDRDVPEPASVPPFGSALAGLGFIRRRRS